MFMIPYLSDKFVNLFFIIFVRNFSMQDERLIHQYDDKSFYHYSHTEVLSRLKKWASHMV